MYIFDQDLHERMKEELQRKKAESRGLNMVANILLSEDLADDELPETVKIASRIMLEANKLHSKMDLFMDIAGPDENWHQMKDLYPLRLEILEYLLLMNAGIDSFLTENNLSPEK